MDCSVGVARTKLLAKLASEAAKPIAATGGRHPGRGVVVVLPREELPFLHALPIRALWGVGPATARRLDDLGGHRGRPGRHPGGHPLPGARRCPRAPRWPAGAGRRPPAGGGDRPAKSVGHEETFAADLHDRGGLHRHVVRMADAVGSVSARRGWRGRPSPSRSASATAAPSRGRTPWGRRSTPAARERCRRGAARRRGRVARCPPAGGIGVGPRRHRRPVASSRSTTLGPRPERVPGPATGRGRGGRRCPPDGGGAGPATAWHEVEAAVAAIRARYGNAVGGARRPASGRRAGRQRAG